MNTLSKAFISCALIYFILGTTLGFLMIIGHANASWGAWNYYLIPTHTHLNLLGWISMTVYAIGYRAFPAFFGKNLYSLKLAWAHFALANSGLIGMGLFFFLKRVYGDFWGYPLMAAGILQMSGIYLFAFNLLMSIFSKTTDPKLSVFHAPPPGKN